MGKNLIETSLLSAKEREWLDAYHAEILEKVGFVEDYLNTEDYEKFVMEFIDEQKQMVEELGLSKK